jgi:hypothetical protein
MVSTYSFGRILQLLESIFEDSKKKKFKNAHLCKPWARVQKAGRHTNWPDVAQDSPLQIKKEVLGLKHTCLFRPGQAKD